jgi:hypothetical protein
MTYTIRKTDGTILLELADGLKDDASSSITFIGRNLSNFGEFQNNNFLRIVENFAFSSPPENSIRGQVWYDTDDYRLKVSSGGDWLPIPISHYSDTKPDVGRSGYLWFDSQYQQLYIHNGTDYTIIGPERAKGFNETRLVTTTTSDLYNTPHPIVKITIDGETVAVISTSGYDVNSLNAIDGIPYVYRGITLKNHLSGDFEIHGRSTFANLSTTSTNVEGGVLGSILYQTSAGYTSFIPIATATSVLVSSGSTPHWSSPNETILGNVTTATNLSGGLQGGIPYQTSPGRTTFLPFVSNARVLVSGNGVPYWKAENEFGAGTALTATRALSVMSSIDPEAFVYSSTSSVAQTIVERSSNGNIYGADFVGTRFYGIAMAAQYADLAEKYLADADYEIGTVVMIGGDKEITASKWGKRAIGAVSNNPAYLMNKDLEGGTIVALKGRIPIKVSGSVKKGDELIASDNGCAIVGVPHATGVFAIALETNNDVTVKLVEAVVL